MQIPKRRWDKYTEAHRRVQQKAAEELAEYYDTLSWEGDELLAEQLLRQKATELAARYGIADATLSAGMYDELMEMWGADVPPAEVIEADTDYVSRDVQGAVRKARTHETARSMASGALAGHVKRAGVETMRHNAVRDRAMWAWVCIGDSCAFCRVLGSRGWQPASRSMVAGHHAEHVHDNCDCQIMVKKPGESLDIEGYDPDALKREYEDAGGKTSKDTINAMRRADYTPEKAAKRNARRRELYAEAVSPEKKAQRAQAIAEEKERRRVAALSDEAKVVFGSKQFVKTFGNAAASRTETAIEDAMRSGDGRRVNAARLLSRDIKEGFEVERVDSGGSRYLTGTGKVKLDKDGASSVRTIAHELAHRRDELSALSYIATKLTGDVELTTSAGSWSSMDFEHGNRTLAARFRASKNGVTPAWKALKRRLKVKSDDEVMAKIYEANPDIVDHPSDFVSLSDIIRAASNGKKSLGYGHAYKTGANGSVIRDARGNPVPYWDDTTRVIETWADYSAALVTSEREAQLIQEMFPDEAAIMDAMMEVMVS